MVGQIRTWAPLLGALVLSGCSLASEKFYTCSGEKYSYKSEYDFSTVKFEDFLVVLTPKFSLSALLQGEKMYEVDGDVFTNMTAISHNYRIFAENDRADTTFIFDLISKKFSFTVPNHYKRNDFYEGRCVTAEI